MFVVFEGIDGSGKTTISNRVAAELAREGLSVKHLRAEGKFVSPVVEGIREFGRNAQHLDLSWQAEFLLYVARDVQLLHEALRPALASHDVVLADRFLYTPEVLGRYGRHLPDAFTRPILAAAADGLEPDLVILVDVDPTFARARRKLRKLSEQRAKPPSRKGLSGAGLQQRLRRGYLALAAAQPERWVVLENEDSLERGVERAVELVRRARREGAPAALARYRSERAPRASASVPRARPVDAVSAFLSVVDGLTQREPRVAAYLLGGMHGSLIDERRQRLFELAPDAVLAGLHHLVDPVSHQLRRRASRENPGGALRSLGLAARTAAGWELWSELAAAAPVEALFALSGSDEPRAWQARLQHFEAQPHLRAAVVGTLGGLDTAPAWQLRERLLREHQPQLGSDYELARLVCKSISGLADARSWQLRRESEKCAPVAALSSLSGVDDEESWSCRSQLLHKAPKAVMSTLRGRDSELAWQMRHAVAADCKEALDGLQGVDSAEAWRLRYAYADVWPSTVAKSLALLTERAPARELLERLLTAHPDNVSLLKHAASIQLGLQPAGGTWESS